MAFDFVANPELRDSQLDLYYWESPHKQIFENFTAHCVKVHDGDTITLRWQERDFDFPLRFAEINTKELNEGGDEAREFLRTRIENEEVDIEINKKNRVDKYGRLLGKVRHRGLDMGETMISMGLATPISQKGEGQFPALAKLFQVKEWQI